MLHAMGRCSLYHEVLLSACAGSRDFVMEVVKEWEQGGVRCPLSPSVCMRMCICMWMCACMYVNVCLCTYAFECVYAHVYVQPRL